MAEGDFEELAAELEQELEGASSDAERLSLTLPFVLRVVDAERGFVLMHEEGSEVVVAAHNLDASTLLDTADVSQTVLRRTLTQGEPIISDNAVMDERFVDSNSILLSALRAVMCLPFRTRGRTVGLIYLDNRFQKGAFTQKQLRKVSRLVSAVSNSLMELGSMTRKDAGQGGWGDRRKF